MEVQFKDFTEEDVESPVTIHISTSMFLVTIYIVVMTSIDKDDVDELNHWTDNMSHLAHVQMLHGLE